MGNPYRPYPAVIRKTIDENDAKDIRTFRFAFRDEDAKEAFSFRAGQFAELSLFGVGESPIGIASSPMDRDYVEFTVKRMGVVTTALHRLETGDSIGIRGPYGNGFPMEEMEGTNIVVVAGGFAFTTLRSLTNYILHPDNRDRFGELTVIYGAREPGELIYKYDLDRWGKRDDIQLHVTVDAGDGNWTGLVGYVPTVLGDVSPSAENAFAVVCGPPVMIRFSLPVLEKLGFPPSRILNSLEMRMKCGMGHCGRCNIGPLYVCKDGPVFTLEQLQNTTGEY
ncbi:MAG: heterodisulfide reductase subunit F [Chloroflexi bacterium RBG_13_56_8]|nr:MAG: heterodisulfide reductase subunit F [Chloroflexi bacterium RBG_13_56_8]